MTQPQTWQESLNPQLAQRLIRPLVQPGVINTQIARKIIERSQYFTNRLPLLANRRWASVTNLQAGQTPIVYAQGQPPVTSTESGQESLDSPSLEAGKLPVVQAKLVSKAQSGGVPHQPANNSPTVPSGYPITSPLPLSENPKDSQLLVQRKLDSAPAGSYQGELGNSIVGNLPLPIVQSQDVGRNRDSQVVVVSERTEAPAPPTPLVFSKMTTEVRPETNNTNQAAAGSNQTRQRMPGAGGQGGFSIEGLQVQNYPEAIANHSQRSEPVPVAQVDVEAIANKVERKLMRRLVVESERRGKKQWP